MILKGAHKSLGANKMSSDSIRSTAFTDVTSSIFRNEPAGNNASYTNHTYNQS